MERDHDARPAPHCQACRKAVAITPPVGRRETCPFCGADLHCCLNCAFYAPGAYNACREPQAERVLEKGRGNFCDFFSFGAASPGDDRPAADPAREKLADLFRRP